MIKTIIVDDEPLDIEALVSVLNNYFNESIQIIAKCNDFMDAKEKIDSLKPELIFLDIEMSPFDGFQLLNLIEEKDVKVIFTSNYFDKYIKQALRISAIDFVEKPVDPEKLSIALQTYNNKMNYERNKNLINYLSSNNHSKKIILAIDCNTDLYINTDNIIRCKNDKSYSDFYYIDIDDHNYDKNNEAKFIKNKIISKGMYKYQEYLLGTGMFFKTHKRHIINVKHIKSKTDRYLIMLGSEEKIPISRSNVKLFKKFIETKDDFLKP